MVFVFDISQLSLAHLDSMEKVDATRQDVAKLVRRLHTLRNSLAPINARLPKEVLCEIFLHLTSSQDVSRDGLAHPFSEFNTCRYWRDTALEYPRLWTDVPVGRNLEWLNLLISRSKSAPLRITHHLPEDATIPEAFYHTILNQLPRTHELDIRVPETLWSEFMAKLPDASVLGILRLRVPSGLSSTVSAVPLPRLRHLELHSLLLRDVRKLIASSSTLTKLVVRQTRKPQSVSAWIKALDNLPVLQELSLENVFKRQEDDAAPPPAAECSHFPQLRRLALKEPWDGKTSAHFLRGVVFPASAVTIFSGEILHHGGLHCDPIHGAIDEKTRNETYGAARPHRAYRLSDITSDHSCAYIFNLWTTQEAMHNLVHVDGREPASSEPHVTVIWRRSTSTCMIGAMWSILTSFHSPRLRTLCFDGGVDPEGFDVWHHSSRFTALRELHILDQGVIYDLLGFLAETNPQPDELFPCLEELTLSRVRWGFFSDSVKPPKRSSRRLDLQSVRNMLASRKAKNMPLERIKLDKCRDSGRGQLARFAGRILEEGLVKSFEWHMDSNTSGLVESFEWHMGSDTSDD